MVRRFDPCRAEALSRVKDPNWNRMAGRHNAAVEAKAPLLASAGLIRPLTAEEIQASYERWCREREQLRLQQVPSCRALPAPGLAARFEGRAGSVGRAPLSTTGFERVWGGLLARGSGALVVGAQFRRWAGGEIAS